MERIKNLRNGSPYVDVFKIMLDLEGLVERTRTILEG